MVDEYLEKTFFLPGELCMVKQDIDNKPKMMVVEKVTRSLMNKDTGVKESMFLGIKCRWFTKDGLMQEAVFNTKDLIKVEND